MLCLVALASCEPASLSRIQLIEFIRENDSGLNAVSRNGNWEYRVTYQPTELVMHNDWEQLTPDKRDAMRKQYQAYDYFTFQILSTGGKTENSFVNSNHIQLQNYLNGRIKADLVLEVDGQVYEPLELLFVPNFGLTEVSTVMVVFESGLHYKKGGDVTIRFTDSLFGSGTHQFVVALENIKSVPALAFSL